MTGKEMKFEAALEKLEEIVKKLEGGDLSLDESLGIFEEGVKLARICSTRLAAAERRIELLMKDEKGQPSAVPFDAAEPDPEE